MDQRRRRRGRRRRKKKWNWLGHVLRRSDDIVEHYVEQHKCREEEEDILELENKMWITSFKY